ncbi:MAG: YfiR family protein [Bernardetiaceae bacterium]
MIGLIPASHAQRGGYGEFEIKAGILLKFAEYTQWLPEAFGTPTERIRLGILGKDPFGNKIDQLLLGRPVHGRYWDVRRSDRIRDLWGCHIIYIPGTEEARLEDALSYYNQFEVLTIGDGIAGFCEKGGIINFTGDFRFEANIDAAKRSKLIIDSRLLRLARRIVRTTND